MPTLPTLTVTQAQFDRISACFNNDPVAYKTWLKQRIKDAVIQHENDLIIDNARAQAEANATNVNTDLGTMT